jgi:hypothetical protein
VIDPTLLPPEMIEPLVVVIVMPLPLSEANPMLHPILTAETAGRVTDIDAPGVL